MLEEEFNQNQHNPEGAERDCTKLVCCCILVDVRSSVPGHPGQGSLVLQDSISPTVLPFLSHNDPDLARDKQPKPSLSSEAHRGPALVSYGETHSWSHRGSRSAGLLSLTSPSPSQTKILCCCKAPVQQMKGGSCLCAYRDTTPSYPPG